MHTDALRGVIPGASRGQDGLDEYSAADCLRPPVAMQPEPSRGIPGSLSLGGSSARNVCCPTLLAKEMTDMVRLGGRSSRLAEAGLESGREGRGDDRDPPGVHVRGAELHEWAGGHQTVTRHPDECT